MEQNAFNPVVRTVNTDFEILITPALATRYEALIRVFREITARSHPEELFATLANELHRVLPFDCVGLSIREEDTDSFHDHFIDMQSGSILVRDENITRRERFEWWVYEHQEPLMTSTDEINSRYERLHAVLRKRHIRSTCTLPLTTAHRKLGTISFCSKQPDTYSVEEVRFLALVAGAIALAFDNAINVTALRRAYEELESKNGRLELLLDITNRVVSNLQLRDLLRAVSRDVRRVMQCDYTGLSLPDAESKQLRLFAFDFPESKGILQEEFVYPIEGSPTGTAFRTMKPLTLQSPFTGWSNSPIVAIAVREGLRSFCFLPLISRNRAIGVLVLGRLRDDAFSQTDVSFLSQAANQIALAVENALAYQEIRELKEQLSKEKLYLEDEIRAEMNFSQMIGNSASLHRVLTAVETVATTDSTVLIYGETGTGKELIARAIHDLSPRRSKPFVKLNCAAIPTGLLESELFGHEKGAFTGAIAERIGRFEVADGGTIFLDEIGEIPLELQTKLLRVLQEREFERLGSSRTLRTDARLIGATNRDLEAMVSEQKFRSDLFFRLNVFPVHIPPLREREGDIPLLVRHFTQQFSKRMNKVIESIPSAAMDALCRYHWPGNVRELQNIVERAVIISKGPALSIDVSDLKFPKADPRAEKSASPKLTGYALHDVLEETERQQILVALKQCNWIVAGPKGAAARLGVKRSTLQLRMHKLGIVRGSA
jgi:formate hydrogenlyase transcriptional activator